MPHSHEQSGGPSQFGDSLPVISLSHIYQLPHRVMQYKLPNNLAQVMQTVVPPWLLLLTLKCCTGGGYTAAGHGHRSQRIHQYTTFMSTNRANQLSVALLPLFEMTEDAITTSQKMWYIVQVKVHDAECRTGWGRWARAEWSPQHFIACFMSFYLHNVPLFTRHECLRFITMHVHHSTHIMLISTHTYLPPCHQQNWHLGAQESWW